jgi:lysozyme
MPGGAGADGRRKMRHMASRNGWMGLIRGTMLETLEQMIERHEGYRATPYIDSLGVQTIGIGHNLHKPLTRAAIVQILHDDLDDATNECRHAFPWWSDLSEPRQRAIVNMCFNLGLPKLQKFVKFLKAMELGDYETAANEMLNSLWAKQVKGRAIELAAIIRGSAEV